MIIPSDLPLQEDANAYNTTLPKLPHNNSNIDNNSSMDTKKKFFPGDFKSMQKLRNLVRGYCALSSEAERGMSDEAKEILEITGYSLPKKTATAGDSNNSRAVLSNRRLVIQKIAPVLTKMEKRKEHDIKQWECDTRCRVTKSGRSGRYRYYDIESNQKVGSQEYKRRYISILEYGRPGRLANANTWMNNLNHVKKVNAEKEYANEVPQGTTATLKTNDHSENFPAYEETISIDIDYQEQNSIEAYAIKQRAAFSPPMNNNLVRVESAGRINAGATDRMEICDLSMSLDYGEQQSSGLSMANNCHPETTIASERSEIAEISEASSEDTDDNQRESRSSSPVNSIPTELATPMVVDDAVTGTIRNMHAGISILETRNEDGSPNMSIDREDGTETAPLLPFPSRDTESIDPDIAAAERRLWDKIDLALDEYSGEVMMIEEKKKRSMEAHLPHGEQNQL